jgi:hypothetical protein
MIGGKTRDFIYTAEPNINIFLAKQDDCNIMQNEHLYLRMEVGTLA